MKLPDIDKTLNILVYKYRYDEFYRGVHVVIAQKENCMWVVIYSGKIFRHEHESFGHAMAYAMGYIDASGDWLTL